MTIRSKEQVLSLIYSPIARLAIIRIMIGRAYVYFHGNVAKLIICD